MLNSSSNSKSAPWNKGRLTGQKRPLKPKDVWAIRVRLQLQHRRRDLALFNLAVDSKLRGCDLVRLQVNDVCVGGQVRDRTTVIQKKTDRRSSSRSPSRPEHQSEIGFPASRRDGDSISSPAAYMRSLIYRPGSMRESSMLGSPVSGSIAPPTGHIRCGGRRRRRSIRRRGT
jgi:hypothetical protein